MGKQDNVALIQKLFDAFGRGDIQTILDHVTADSDWSNPGPASIPYAGTFRGPDEIRRYFERLAGTQSAVRLTTDQFVAQGDTVVALGRYAGSVTATGKPFDLPVALVFRIRDGRVAQHMVFGDTAAMAASYGSSAAAAT